MSEQPLERLDGAKNVAGPRPQRVTEAKSIPVEKAAGRKPIGPPPVRVNPAPQTQTGNSAGSQGRASNP